MSPIDQTTDLTFDTMPAKVGEALGTSDWVDMTQDRVNQFAECTKDHQWIHTDPERAKRESPFGGPVAHGYLTLSLLAGLSSEMDIVPKGAAAVINYGLDKVRFLAPVPVGARVRLHMKLMSWEQTPKGPFMMKTENTVEIEGSDKPALIAENIGLVVPPAPSKDA
ncbi:MAG: MaoC family dehydratase [Pseudomonadota bacterium]